MSASKDLESARASHDEAVRDEHGARNAEQQARSALDDAERKYDSSGRDDDATNLLERRDEHSLTVVRLERASKRSAAAQEHVATCEKHVEHEARAAELAEARKREAELAVERDETTARWRALSPAAQIIASIESASTAYADADRARRAADAAHAQSRQTLDALDADGVHSRRDRDSADAEQCATIGLAAFDALTRAENELLRRLEALQKESAARTAARFEALRAEARVAGVEEPSPYHPLIRRSAAECTARGIGPAWAFATAQSLGVPAAVSSIDPAAVAHVLLTSWSVSIARARLVALIQERQQPTPEQEAQVAKTVADRDARERGRGPLGPSWIQQ